MAVIEGELDWIIKCESKKGQEHYNLRINTSTYTCGDIDFFGSLDEESLPRGTKVKIITKVRDNGEYHQMLVALNYISSGYTVADETRKFKIFRSESNTMLERYRLIIEPYAF